VLGAWRGNLIGGGPDAGGSTSGNDPRCPGAVPQNGDFCNDKTLSCSWTDGAGYTFAYCDGTNWEVMENPTGCPVADPAAGGANCGTFSKTCKYLMANTSDCFETCSCVSGAWKCNNTCDCVPSDFEGTAGTPQVERYRRRAPAHRLPRGKHASRL
jgi:hypothetical protein